MLYEGASGSPATAQDSAGYAETIDFPNFPIFADGNQLVAETTPLTNETLPEVCSLAPDLTIIKCYSGHGGYENSFNDIRIHAGM